MYSDAQTYFVVTGVGVASSDKYNLDIVKAVDYKTNVSIF